MKKSYQVSMTALMVAGLLLAACKGDEEPEEDAGIDAGTGQEDSGAAALEVSDPAEPGAFNTGVWETTIEDHLSVNGEARPLHLVVWYPTDGEGEVDETLQGIVEAPLAEGGPFPLIGFSHGLGGYASQSTFQVQYMATHGFVIASVDHPNSTLMDCGGTFCLDNPAAIADSASNRPSETRAAVDFVIAESKKEGGLLADAVDEERVGVMGHSFGGMTTLALLAEEDSRFKTGIPMAPATILGQIDWQNITSPLMFMVAEKDSLVGYAGAIEDYSRIPESTERFIFIFPNADHFAYNDICLLGCTAEGALDHELGHQLINTYGTAFMQVYLAGLDDFAHYLQPADDIEGGEARLVKGDLP